MLKEYYLKIENFGKEKPVLFWVISSLIVSIPIITFWQKFINFLLTEYLFYGYQAFLATMLILIVLIFLNMKKSNPIKQTALKDLESINVKLQCVFEIEQVSPFNKVKTVSKFYHNEILECFDEYNKIVENLKAKYPEEFNELKFRLDKPKKGNDWVRYDEMQIIRSDVSSLIQKLK